jgi:hypothetical protein
MKKQERDNNLIILVNKVKDSVLRSLVIDLFRKCKVNLMGIKNIQLYCIQTFMEMILNQKIQVKMNITISI